MRTVFEGLGQRLDRKGDRGITAIEYGLIATALALLVSAAVIGLGPKILAAFSSI